VSLLFPPQSAWLLQVSYSPASVLREEPQPQVSCPSDREGLQGAPSCVCLQQTGQPHWWTSTAEQRLWSLSSHLWPGKSRRGLPQHDLQMQIITCMWGHLAPQRPCCGWTWRQRVLPRRQKAWLRVAVKLQTAARPTLAWIWFL